MAKAAPDGYTLLVVQFPLGANPWLYKSLPYDTLKDFTPVILAGQSPMTLVVTSGSPIRSVGDLVKSAKGTPGKITLWLVGQRLVQPPCHGAVRAQCRRLARPGALQGQHAHADRSGRRAGRSGFRRLAPCAAVREIRQGARARRGGSEPLRVAVHGAHHGGERPARLRRVIMARHCRAGRHAPEIVRKLNAQINDALRTADVRNIFHEQGVSPAGGSPADFSAFIGKELTKWKQVVHDADIPLQ
ncbi:tripartite tricarboxylate transporter substrate-binding protein [Cupriavidus basilensis]